ncbi:MAG: hypothetical protein JSR39_07930 [Verrucomicrobia bacterium]|nr:hypothetical protein [Verrucomicrobiota bacterium]
MAVDLRANFYLNDSAPATLQPLLTGDLAVANRALLSPIDTDSEVHEYVKRVFFDANAASNMKDDVANFKGLAISTGVRNVHEMAKHLKGHANFVTLCGHGGPGFQGLGSGGREGYWKGYDICVGELMDIDEEISLLYQFLTVGRQSAGQPAPVLFLAGCQVASGREGSTLLKQLSAKMPNVLVVASEDPLTYRKCSTVVKISKLVKGHSSQMPIEFKFALNGRKIEMEDVQARTGHDEARLEQELTEYSKN